VDFNVEVRQRVYFGNGRANHPLFQASRLRQFARFDTEQRPEIVKAESLLLLVYVQPVFNVMRQPLEFREFRRCERSTYIEVTHTTTGIGWSVDLKESLFATAVVGELLNMIIVSVSGAHTENFR